MKEQHGVHVEKHWHITLASTVHAPLLLKNSSISSHNSGVAKDRYILSVYLNVPMTALCGSIVTKNIHK